MQKKILKNIEEDRVLADSPIFWGGGISVCFTLNLIFKFWDFEKH